MDQFESLSIKDDFERRVNEDDLLSISKLSISDNNQKLSAAILNKYMQYFPSSPSPLRNSLNCLEAFSDEMDVDQELETSNQPVELKIKPEYNREQRSITFELPEGGRRNVIKEEQVTNEEVKEEVDDREEQDKKHNTHTKSNDKKQEVNMGEDMKEDNLNGKNIIKALLSPTSLGIAAATKIDGIPIEFSREEEEILSDVPIEDTDVTMSRTGWDPIEIKDELRKRNHYQPIHVSINNHHHYYPSSGGYYSEAESRPLIFKSNGNGNYQNDIPIEEFEKLKLPVPWSEKSYPVSRNSYILTSYLQLFLNCITITVIFSFITSFIRTLRKDIKSIWEYKKSELDYESSLCKSQFLINECHINVRPALEDQCQQWEMCMSRNNDIFFRARSTLSAKLFGEVINSFIEPIGWKALSVIVISIVVWCFCSNFLLGFVRAKSYYGSPAHQLISQQKQQKKQQFSQDQVENYLKDDNHLKQLEFNHS